MAAVLQLGVPLRQRLGLAAGPAPALVGHLRQRGAPHPRRGHGKRAQVTNLTQSLAKKKDMHCVKY